MNQYTSSLVQEFINIFSENPEEIVIVDALSGSIKKKKDFLSEIYFLAKGFQENGMLPWDTVVILTQDSVLYTISIFATLLSWGRIAIIDPEMGKENMRKKLKILKPRFCLIDGTIIDGIKVAWVSQFFHPIFRNLSLKDLENIPAIFVNWRNLFKSKNLINISTFEKWGPLYILPFDDNSDAIIVFTGGTTAEPKWVIHSHKSLFESIMMIDSILWDEQVFYADLPHFLLFWLMLRKTVIAWRDSMKPRKLRELFIQHKVQSTFFAPYKIQEFIVNHITLPGYVTHLLLGSAPVFVSFLKKMVDAKIISENTRISCIYGMTEALPIAVIDGREKIAYNESLWDNLWTILPGIEYKIIDNELLIRARHTMKTYLWKPPLEYIPTWDIIEIQWGSIAMIWRQKDMIIKWNYNIYPSLYEWTILNITWVNECVLFWVNMGDYDERIILLVQGKISRDDLYRELRGWEFSIDRFAIPDDIIFWKIPKYGRQKKINKTILQKLYLSGTLWK